MKIRKTKAKKSKNQPTEMNSSTRNQNVKRFVVIFVVLSDKLPKFVVVAILLVDIAALLSYFCIIAYALVMYPVNIFQRRR